MLLRGSEAADNSLRFKFKLGSLSALDLWRKKTDLADMIARPSSALDLFHRTKECFSENMKRNQEDKKWALRPIATKTGPLQMSKMLATASKRDTAV